MTELESLQQELLKPSDALITQVAGLDGDILILGVGGKMGPALALLARQAVDQAGLKILDCPVVIYLLKLKSRLVSFPSLNFS